MRHLILLCITLSLCSAALHAEDKSDPRENLDTAIPEAIRLLEKQEYETLLKMLVPPMRLEKILESEKSLPEFAKFFGEKKAARLLQALQATKDIRPTLNEDKTVAVFTFKEPIKSKADLQFQKIDKYWYIKD